MQVGNKILIVTISRDYIAIYVVIPSCTGFRKAEEEEEEDERRLTTFIFHFQFSINVYIFID